MYGSQGETSPGVYAVDEQGALTLVHEYHNNEYSLADVQEHFGLGRVEHDDSDLDAVLVLGRKEVRELKVNADAYSFDYDEGFILMCLDIERFFAGSSGDDIRLVSID